MTVFHDFNRVKNLKGPVSAAVGNFDGVHRGHCEILKRAVESAKKTGGSSVAVTFHPHPLRVLALDKLQPMISTFEQKTELLETQGIDAVLVVPFTKEFAAHPPDKFIGELADSMELSEIVVGEDFRFGHLNTGDIETLKKACRERGIESKVVPLLEADGEKLSSTRIRHLLGEGKVEDAAALLGRSYFIDGTVVDGDRIGRTLGFATANLQSLNEIIPGTGVYATRLHVKGEAHPSATNVGFRPTFELQSGIRVETHILSFDPKKPFNRDILGEKVRLEFVKFVREEIKFPGEEELKKQIAKDIEEILATLR